MLRSGPDGFLRERCKFGRNERYYVIHVGSDGTRASTIRDAVGGLSLMLFLLLFGANMPGMRIAA